MHGTRWTRFHNWWTRSHPHSIGGQGQRLMVQSIISQGGRAPQNRPMTAHVLLVSAFLSALVSVASAFAPPIPTASASSRLALLSCSGRVGPARLTARSTALRRGAVADFSGISSVMMSEQRLITKPRTSHAWFGVYFDVAARDVPVTIQTIESGCSSGADGQKLKVQLWVTKEGSFQGKEEDPSAWECMGDEEMVLNTINYDKAAYDANAAQYGALPLKTQIQIMPGNRRGFMVYTDSPGGLILRGGFGPEAQKNNWKVGEKADETIHMELMAGPVTSSQPFTLEKDSPGKCARQ